MTMEFKLGAIPSPEDSRDYNIARLVATVNVFPDNFMLSYTHNMLNQADVGSCVPHSFDGYCRSMTEEKQSGKYQLFSVREFWH